MKILSIGGSGFVSGTLARVAVEAGHDVSVVTRARRPLTDEVTAITADREDPTAFADALSGTDGWDLVIDCIGYDPKDAEQDVAVFRNRCKQLVFVSTDFVFEPSVRRFPQREEEDVYATEGYGWKKRQCEQILERSDFGGSVWTVVRPCHIYGPGSKLGCLPKHGRDDGLIERIKAGQPLDLVGGGHFLQQPIFASDLCRVILSAAGNPDTYGRIFCTAGPDIIESRTFYDLIADVLGVPRAPVNEVSVQQHLTDNPAARPFCCHRVYSLDRLLDAGLYVPAKPVADGLREHVESLIA